MTLRALRAALLALVWAGAAHAQCSVAAQVTVPLRAVAGHLVVTVAVDGDPARLILDTGAERTLLTPAAVRRLALPLDRWVGTTTVGIGGEERHQNAQVATLSLGGLALRQNTLLQGLNVTVGTISRGQLGAGQRPIDGLLGRDVLSAFDLAIDVPRLRLTLYRVRGCAGRFVPWPGAAAVTALPGYARMLGIPVRANGRPLRAMIDTGSSATLLAAPGMIQLGLTPAQLARGAAGSATGIGPRTVPVHVVQLATLTVGGITARDMRVVAARVRLHPTLDLLLGLDWLARRKVWLSYATGQVFVAPEGHGPAG